MYEEMETANHSGNEEVTEQITETIETPTEGNDSPPQEEPRGIKVKYNKEDRYVSEEEAPDWIQKGMNYDKVSEKADRYQQMLDRTAKINGFEDHEAYISALDEYETNQRIQEEAEKLNVSEDVIREYIQPLKQELDELKGKDKLRAEEEMVRSVEAKLNSMESDTANYPDFSKHKASILTFAAEKGYALEDAYKIVTFDDRVNSARTQAQQETIRSLQQNADSSTGSLGADSPEHAGGYSAMSPAERKAFRESVKGRAN
jgi:hypothetical protein